MKSDNSTNTQFFKTYKETETWLNKMRIRNYSIDEKSLVVDVNDNVSLTYTNISKIPVKFGKVSGWFSVRNNDELTSLIGSPDTAESIDCSSTNITDFNGLGNISVIYANNISSLKSFYGLPKTAHVLSIENSCNNINTLDHFPKTINMYLIINQDFKMIDMLPEYMDRLDSLALRGKFNNYSEIMDIKGLTEVRCIDSINVSGMLNNQIHRKLSLYSNRI